MPAPVKSRGVAAVGMVALVPIALGLVRHSLTLSAAATRAVILLVILWALDTLIVPLGRMALASPDRRENDRQNA